MVILCLSAVALSWIGTLAMRECAGILTPPREPNERDNHAQPTPKGGGIAVMIAVMGFLTVAGVNGTVVWALLLLTVVSAMDDFLTLRPLPRLLAHMLAAVMMVSALEGSVFQGVLPETVEFILLVLLLGGFMNLYNFMDGVDEITSMQTTALSLGCIVVAAIAPDLGPAYIYDGLIIIAAIAGFWYFNRHPASIFMGDSGSIPLGALMGWLLLSLAVDGYPAAALILPAYYLVDGGVTLAKRALVRKPLWEAHSEHAYQCYVRAGHTHTAVVRWIAFYNFVAIGLAGISVMMPHSAWLAVGVAYALAFVVYGYLKAQGRQSSSAITVSKAHATS